MTDVELEFAMRSLLIEMASLCERHGVTHMALTMIPSDGTPGDFDWGKAVAWAGDEMVACSGLEARTWT